MIYLEKYNVELIKTLWLVRCNLDEKMQYEYKCKKSCKNIGAEKRRKLLVPTESLP